MTKKIKNTRAKGNRLEFQVQSWFKKKAKKYYSPMFFKRVGMSGQLEGKKGDFEWEVGWFDCEHEGAIEIIETFRGEAKSGQMVSKKLWDWLKKDKSDFLIVKRDREPWLIVMTQKLLEALLV